MLSSASKQEPGMKERDIILPVRITAAEKRKFVKLAASRYSTLSALIRQLLHREADSKTSRTGA